ncbi:MAG TPA: DUF2127 domain-containing protein [Myxococcales bacterium]|nr:DUF2127 domain-containing protein [Myxococcales bacterium]
MIKRAIGLEAIIIYKLVKAVLEALLGLAAVYLVTRGAEAGAATLAEVLLEHFAGGWALEAATLIVMAGTSGHVKFVAVASFGDAVLSAIEGLALRAGRWWAPWLVVIATGALLPWEVVELIAHPKWGRFVILFINLAVVAYLLRQVVREHRERSVRLRTRAVDTPADAP